MISYKKLAPLAMTALFILLVLSVERRASSQSATLANGVSYLKSTQNGDGSWGGTPTSLNGVFRTTAAVIEALRAAEETTSPNQTNAVQFLASQTVAETPFLAARVIALNGAGSSSSLPADVDALIARQNADGGWGTAEGFESDTLDTSLALVA